MSEFSTDVRQTFSKGTTARASLLDLVPRVDRVDSYAGSKYKSTLEPVRTELDSILQNQRETATESKSAIDTWLMLQESANDPSFLQDIIDECTNTLNLLGKNASKANSSPERIQRITEQVLNLKTQLESTIKEKDKAIDLGIEDSTKEVDACDTEMNKIDAELAELRKQQKQGNLGKLVDVGKGIADKLKSPSTGTGTASTTGTGTASTTGTGGETEDPALKEKIKKLEAQRAALQEQYDTARERKRQAVALGDQRTSAKGTDPVGGANKAHMDLTSYGTASDNLLGVYTGLTREITTYQRLFQAKKDDNSAANQKALADEIKKVQALVPKLKQLQAGLVDGAHNL